MLIAQNVSRSGPRQFHGAGGAVPCFSNAPSPLTHAKPSLVWVAKSVTAGPEGGPTEDLTCF